MKDTPEITPAIVLQAYRAGVFPMAEDAQSDALFWVDPPRRGVFFPGDFHASRSLKKRIKSGLYEASLNQCFGEVMRHCARRDVTWINPQIHALYGALHDEGYAHSIEIWRGDSLVGGVYGLALGGVFFGESMFSAAVDGSKLALYALMNRLRDAGFSLFDTQFLTPHLASLGAVEISRARYHALLRAGLNVAVAPDALAKTGRYSLTQPITQIS